MSTLLVQTRLTMPSTVLTDFNAVCLFSLLGLTLSVAVLSWLSDEAISVMFIFFLNIFIGEYFLWAFTFSLRL